MNAVSNNTNEKPPKSYLVSILSMNCPHCRKGKLFKTKWPMSFSELVDMNEKCEVCHRSTEMEPGFYYGAMYVAYALTVAIFVAVWVAFSVLVGSVFDYPWTFLSIDIAATILLMPFTFRMARSVWAHLFMKYKGENMEESTKNA